MLTAPIGALAVASGKPPGARCARRVGLQTSCTFAAQHGRHEKPEDPVDPGFLNSEPSLTMIKISREWATPLTIGVFGLMAVTGLLMFFHLDSGVQKVVHEWAGWAVVAAVAAHAAANWLGFKRYFSGKGKALAILGSCAAALAITFLPLQGQGGGASPPAIAIQAIARAPIASVAPLFKQTPEQARQRLSVAGITLADDQASIASAIGNDREQLGRALAALSQPAAQ
jgi:hypothetical protein